MIIIGYVVMKYVNMNQLGNKGVVRGEVLLRPAFTLLYYKFMDRYIITRDRLFSLSAI
jgi:hypothetical protein